jgi:hypothetical protein
MNMIDFTQNEQQFLISVIGTLQVKADSPDSIAVATLTHSCLRKLQSAKVPGPLASAAKRNGKSEKAVAVV